MVSPFARTRQTRFDLTNRLLSCLGMIHEPLLKCDCQPAQDRHIRAVLCDRRMADQLPETAPWLAASRSSYTRCCETGPSSHRPKPRNPRATGQVGPEAPFVHSPARPGRAQIIPRTAISGLCAADDSGQACVQLFVSPTRMRKGGRVASGAEPMRFNRSMLGSSDRRIWASSAAMAACFSLASRKS
jgi:hypothetical protein